MTAEAPLLSARGLVVRYGDYVAVNGASFDVRRNEVHALIGPNGAGKSTCFHVISGFVQPSVGEVLFDGRNLVGIASWKRARMGLIRSFQISAIFSEISVLDNVVAAIARREGKTTSLWSKRDASGAFADEAITHLARVGLERDGARQAGLLSYGQKRALEIATTLAMRPSMMRLDGPTAGMTDYDVHKIMDLLASIAGGQTILMVEHNLKVVSSLCHQVTVLQRGEIICSGTYETVSADPNVKAAYLGRAKK